jgi:hypothetical protein
LRSGEKDLAALLPKNYVARTSAPVVATTTTAAAA